jgi:hypothetical protein
LSETIFFSYFPVRLINAASSQRDSVGRQKVGCGFTVLSSGFKDLNLFRLNRSNILKLRLTFNNIFFSISHVISIKIKNLCSSVVRDLLVFLDCNFVFFQSSRLDNANDDMAMVKEIRQIASSANFTTIVFNPFFTYIDLVNFWPPLNTERFIFAVNFSNYLD